MSQGSIVLHAKDRQEILSVKELQDLKVRKCLPVPVEETISACWWAPEYTPTMKVVPSSPRTR